MNGRALALVLLLAACTPPNGTPSTASPGSTVIAGNALAADFLAFDSDRTGNYEVFVMRLDGSGVRQLTNDPKLDSWWPRISPDRRRILFYRTPKGVHDTDFTQTSLWVASADGSGVQELRGKGLDGWDQQGHAEWAPDGQRLVMFGGSRTNPQIYVTDASGKAAKKVTDRGGTNIDPSWSRDGATILFIGCPNAICFDKDYEVYSMPASGGEAKRLTNNALRDHDPYFSPDGKQIAWLEQTDASGPTGIWNIELMRADGSDQRAVTKDRQINSKPEWAPDGSVIFFHRFEFGGDKWKLFSIRPDGTGLTELVKGVAGNNEFPSR